MSVYTTATGTGYERAQPTEKQQQIWSLISRTKPGGLCLVGYGGAAGGGKTRGIVELALDLCQDFPGSKILIGRKDFSDLRTTTQEQFDMHCPPALLYRKNDSEHWRELRLKEWPEGVVSRVVFRELKDFMGLGSEEYMAILIDEAGEVPRKSALMLLSRLRWKLPPIIMETRRTPETPWGRASDEFPHGKPPKYVFMAASNPWPGWFEDWFVKREMDEDLLRIFSGAIHFVPALPSDNPYLPPDYEARLRAIYPADWVKRLMDGRWDAFEGQVYPEFSERTHCWRAKLPDESLWTAVIGGLDFGGQNPYDHYSAGMVAIVLKSNRIIRVSEFEERGGGVYDRQVAWMLAQEARWCNKFTGRKLLWVADKTQMVAIHQWTRMGFKVKPSKGGPKSVDFGISMVKRRLDVDASGYPGSFYLPDLESFPERMKVYRYAEPRTDEDVVKREPIKRNDDILDADRYMHERLESTYGPPEPYVKNLMPIVPSTPSGLTLPFPLAGGVKR
jgi:hypothetical protein